jgi:hypothetical protein
MKKKRLWKTALIILASLLGLWLLLEFIMRWYVESPLKADFYGSIPRDAVQERQAQVGVQAASGPGWIHLGWIADPDSESYRIERQADGAWVEVGKTEFGSFLWQDDGTYRVLELPKNGSQSRILGEVSAAPEQGTPPTYVPAIGGAWQSLFKPEKFGYYINDHTVFQDAKGNWRLVGITSKTNGDYNQEKYFATAVSADFPPASGMTETEPVADFGELAWAPSVLKVGEIYRMFWSPHKLHQMKSPDGITWGEHQVTLTVPYHKFFRDGMVIQVAENQWLLYTTARGAYYSQVDIYQSFDLSGWQYIGAALRSGWGSERNSPFSSMESPFVTIYQGRYYLSLTYNNDSFFWPGVLMLFQIWPDRPSYNDTLVFHAENPYDFGVYRGRGNSPTLLTSLKTHAPEIVYNPATDSWYITTAGWPWVATLTHGEAAVAPLKWIKP